MICKSYKGNVNDPKLFDPNFIFMDEKNVPSAASGSSGNAKLSDLIKYQAKKNRGGYDSENTRQTETLINFVKSPNPAIVLTSFAELTIEDEESKALAITEDLRECCQDLKLLGKRDLGNLIKWRMKLRRAHDLKNLEARKAAAQKAAKEAESAAALLEDGKDEDEKDEDKQTAVDAELEEMIAKMKAEERRDLKKVRRRLLNGISIEDC